MPRLLHFRLALLMFLQYAVPGAWVPVFTARLKELGFTPVEMGLSCAASSMASLFAPLAAGQVADRWVSTEKCIGACALVAAGLMWLLPELDRPAAVFACCFGFWVAMSPAITLGVSLCFAHLSDPERQYGGVRLWGTVGWVAPGLALGWWLSDPAVVRWLLEWLRPYEPRGGLADSQRLAALLAFALAAYSLTLPHTPPAKRRTSWLAPLGALRLLRARPFAVFAACSVGLCVTIPFSFQLTPLLLEHLGVPRPWLSPTLTISQSMEVVSLGLLPVLLLRLGVRGTMLLGLAAWCTALAVLMAGRPTWLVIASLALNGICVCCFLVAGQVFVHGRAASDIRASAQALLTFLNGVGLLAGNLLVGVVRELAGGDFDETFAAAVALAAALVVVFLIGFTDSGPRRASAEPLTPSNHQPEA